MDDTRMLQWWAMHCPILVDQAKIEFVSSTHWPPPHLFFIQANAAQLRYMIIRLYTHEWRLHNAKASTYAERHACIYAALLTLNCLISLRVCQLALLMWFVPFPCDLACRLGDFFQWCDDTADTRLLHHLCEDWDLTTASRTAQYAHVCTVSEKKPRTCASEAPGHLL